MNPQLEFPRRALALAGTLAACGALALAAAGRPAAGDEAGPSLDTISEKEVLAHLEFLAQPGMEGRDSPSEGQARAAAYLVGLYREWGLEFAPDSLEVMGENGQGGPEHGAVEGSFYRPYMREVNAPDPEACALTRLDDGEMLQFEYGTDFVPVHRAAGSAKGELVFGGFAIDDSGEKYDDFKSIQARGKIVLFFSGEPRHKKKFEGEEVTPAASLWAKLATLNREGAAGALLVRRPPLGAEDDAENRLDYRYTYATWNDARGSRGPRQPSKSLPTLEISMECATRLLGTDAEKLASKMDSSARPTKVKLEDVVVSLSSQTTRRSIRHDNLLGILRGTDPVLAQEYVLLGAHFDHIGVGPEGLVGCGADDNGSGVSAFLEVAQALAQSPPRRSVIFANFSAEEDGLVGSREIAARLPVPKEQIVCMVNLDQIGFGNEAETSVLGINQNPKLEKVLDRARRLEKTGLRKVITGKGEELWQRSDHYEFHKIGLPVMFFFEGLPISDNKNYHTWRDTVEGVNIEKVANTARMVYNTLWILANDDDRPPEPHD
jgi:hypothetical protein